MRPSIAGLLGLAFAMSCGGEGFTAEDDAQPGGSPSMIGGASSGGVGAESAAAGAAPDEVNGGTAAIGTEAGGGASGVGAVFAGGAPAGGATATGTAGTSASGSGACPSRLDGPLQLGFFPELSSVSTQQIHPFFQIKNDGALVGLERLSIRYYFTDDGSTEGMTTCYWVTDNKCGVVLPTLHAMPTPTPTANAYLELHFQAGSHLSVGLGVDPLEVRVGFGSTEGKQLQSNDYSFDSSPLVPSGTGAFPYRPWSKVTLYLDGELAWGTEPCPQ